MEELEVDGSDDEPATGRGYEDYEGMFCKFGAGCRCSEPQFIQQNQEQQYIQSKTYQPKHKSSHTKLTSLDMNP